jgi:hypothetical protein
MAENESKRNDKWQKWESFAKIMAGFSAAVSAILIPILINSYTEENRKAEMYVRTMTEREKSDTDIRQSMFQSLLTGYLGALKEDFTKADEESFRRRIMFLELLTLNFQEYFNAKPLFEEVYAGLERKRTEPKASEDDKEKWENLEREIIRVSRNIVSRQSTMLNSIGISVIFNIEKEAPICVRLYNREDFANLRQKAKDGVTSFQSFQPGHCIGRLNDGQMDGTKNGTVKTENAGLQVKIKDETWNNNRQSLDIKLVKVEKSRVTVQLNIYDDMFEGNIFQESLLKRSLQLEVSAFDLPYMDNIKLSDGSRFSLVLRQVYVDSDSAEIEAIRFKNDFISLRDRPVFEEMLRKLEIEGKTK